MLVYSSLVSIHRLDIAGSIALMSYAASVVLTPMCLLQMADEISFNLAGGGGIEAARTGIILVTLFVCGVIAARWGKPRSIAGGLLLMAAGMWSLSFFQVYAGIILAMVIIGFGSGIVEALVNPLIQDIHPEGTSKALTIVNAFFSLGILVSVLVSGLLLTWGVSWRVLFRIIGTICGGSALLFLPGSRSAPATGGSSSLRDWLSCLGQPIFWLLASAILLGGACEAAFTFWTASYIQIHFSALPSAAGFGTALFAGGMFTGRIGISRFTGTMKRDRNLLIISATLGLAACLIIVSGITLNSFFPLIFLAGISVAPFWPMIQSISVGYVRDADPTLLYIALSCAGIPGFGAASWIMGIIGDAYGLATAFYLVPLFFVLLLGVLLNLGRQTPYQTLEYVPPAASETLIEP